MTVAQLSRCISSAEVRDWALLWKIEAEERRLAELSERASSGAQQQIQNPSRAR